MQKNYSITDIIPISSTKRPSTVGLSPSVDGDVTRQILESKRPILGEIELTLFENCNIDCDFCFHDKKSTVGTTYAEMVSKLPIITAHFDKLAGRVDFVQINMVGGELFQDHWMEEKCEEYYNLLILIQTEAIRRGIRLEVVWVSNFLWKKAAVIMTLMDRLKAAGIPSSLIASYDLSGRPMSSRYYKNLDVVANYISTINLVATKQAIDKLLAEEDPFFDVMYSKFELYFDDFIPDKGSEWQIPSDSEVLKFYKFLAKKYPKIHPIAGIIANGSNSMHCLALNKVTIFPDNRTSNCRWHRYDQDDFTTEFNIHDNTGMMQRFMDENGCLSCKFFDKCGFRCYVQWDWATRIRDTEECMMRMFLSHVEEMAS